MPAENGMPDNEDVRKKALLRLAVAGIVTAAALGGLWWLDQGGNEQKQTAPEARPPAPIVSAPQTEAPAPAPEQEPASADQQAAMPPPAVAPEAPEHIPPPARAGELPPPPRVSNAPDRSTLATPRAALAPPPAISPAAPPRPPVAAPPAVAAAGKGFVVQLGVFSNPDNARELVEKLNKQGIRAHLEARVQVGPFLNRQEAEKAQAEMRKLGYNALVTLPYLSPPATK